MDKKEKIIQEYLLTKASYRDLEVKYKVSRGTINQWVLNYQGISNSYSKSKKANTYLGSVKKRTTNKKELEQQIAELKKQLDWQTMRAEALDKMIDVAESQMQIPIRKKSGTKRSRN
jgi:transposase-like protein